MTLPSSGQLSIADVNNEVGRPTSYSTDLAWIRDVTKDHVTNLNDLHGRAYYSRNVDGNCDNGNCTSNCNCGNMNCTNCVITGGINCTNCDGQAWLQGNCNCACTYNCTYGQVSMNCQCQCNCDCFWSDDTLKNRENIIENPLDIVHQLDGFYYTGNDLARQYGLDTKRDVGVSAQTIKQHFPVALGSNLPHTDAMQVRYERLIPLLLEALKQLDDKVEQIKK